MVLHRIMIYLADDEWGNETMREVALDWFKKNPERKEDTVVEVHEHGGWSLSYLADGTVVESANDRARFKDRAERFREVARMAQWKYLQGIRRNREAS